MDDVGFPSFSSLFRAVNAGRQPFPWQSRLAHQVAVTGWPASIGVPTGMGKTACIDIAIWSLALQGRASPRVRTAPRRIWYVVNRRLLVDAAFDHAMHLSHILAKPAELPAIWASADDQSVSAVASVARSLRDMAALGSERGPLHVVRLRGGAELGARAPDPSQPTVLLATVAMFGSRFLFRGYGSSARMRPVDAALAGVDSLVLLDEAHLSRPLIRLCDLARESDLGEPGALLPDRRTRPLLVSLTATGEREGAHFDLDEQDSEHEVIARRLNATKPTELIGTSRGELPRELAERALDLVRSRPGSAAVVFCNTVGTAREVKSRLDKALPRSPDMDTVLLTGRMRDREAQRARDTVLESHGGAPSNRPPDVPRLRSLIVVCTQTLEVGADLDFDYLVTETSGVRSMIQRFGRLNRLGSLPHAQGVVCHPADRTEIRPYGQEPAAVWTRLTERGERTLDLSPARIGEVLGQPQDRPERTGELLPDHLWEFAKTNSPEPDEPAVELFFEGFDDELRMVSICWRAFLPGDGVKLLPAVREDEAVEVPIWELRDALKKRGIELVRRLDEERCTLRSVPTEGLRPGDVVLLQASAGLYDESGWNPDARDVVLDVSLLRAGIVWLEPAVVCALTHTDAEAQAAADDLIRRLTTDGPDAEPDPLIDEENVSALLNELGALAPHPWLRPPEWSDFLSRLRAGQLHRDPLGYLPPYLAAPRPRRAVEVEVRADALEELSFDVDMTSALLDDHQESVGQIAERIANALGLPAEICEVLRLAGRHHDIGKADARFQRWLDPDRVPDEERATLLAKSSAPRELIESRRMAAGWPKGGRHEALSARLLARWLEGDSDRSWRNDLLLHLVISHHGRGRPLVPPVADPFAPELTASIDGLAVSASGDLSGIDWDQARRFRKLCERIGVWGLALLEAILCQADHIASRAVEVA